jgi:hypothetical protein
LPLNQKRMPPKPEISTAVAAAFRLLLMLLGVAATLLPVRRAR